MSEGPDTEFKLRKAAWVIILMSVCFAFSYLDRNVLTILTQPIKHSLALTDTQLGVLGGFAFSIFFFLGGLPLAWLIDRTNRIRLTVACVFIWSAATVTSGVSADFTQLLISRAFTAAAEAALIPAGLSIFADMLPVRRIPIASSVMMIGGFVGGGAALYLGGTFVIYFSSPEAAQLFLPQLLPWQRVYLMVGLAGIVPVALLLFTTKEPKRREIVDVGKDVNEKVPPIREVFSYLFVQSRFYAPFILGVCAIFLVFYCVNAWFPTFLIRRFALSASEAGTYLGPAIVVFGIVGSLGSQLFLRRLTPENIVPRIVLLLGSISLVQIANLAALPFVTDPFIAIWVYGLAVGLTGAVLSVMLIPIQLTVPNRMRGQTMSICYCGVNLLGTGLGPFLVGFMNERFFEGGASLGVCMAGVSVSSAIIATILFTRSYLLFTRQSGVAKPTKPPAIIGSGMPQASIASRS
jgi:MFS family permease